MPVFHRLADQLHDLLGCGAVHLLLGCPEPQLRHPLLELFPSNHYFAIGGSAVQYARNQNRPSTHDAHKPTVAKRALYPLIEYPAILILNLPM